MATAPEGTTRSFAGTVPGVSDREREPHEQWAATVVLTLALTLPSLISVVIGAREPMGDIALIELRIRDVISANPPLTGAYSRYGWDHPGPIFFWVATGPYRLLGGGATALGLTALAVNSAAIATLLRLTIRLGRAAWYVVAIALVALVLGLSPNALASVWNVTITNTAIVLFAVACWAVWCRIERAGIVAIVAGSFVVQSHVGTGVVIAPLAIATAGFATLEWWRRGRPPAATVGPAVAVAGLWLLPVADLVLRPPGNLVRLVRWSLTNDEPTIGIGTATRLLARTSSLTFPGAPRLDRGVFLDIDVVPVGFLPGASLVLLAGAWAVARRAGWRRESLWCAIVGSLWLSGLVAAASITVPLGWWLVQWLEPIGWLTWSAIALVGWRLVSQARPAVRDSPAATSVAVVALAVGVAADAVQVARAHEAETATDRTIRELTDGAVGTNAAEPVAVVALAEPLLAEPMLAGLVASLDRRGVEACVADELQYKFRDHRVCRDRFGSELVLRLERATTGPPPGSVTVVIVDPLTDEQRAEADRITTELAEILRLDGRADEIPVLDTPLADVIVLGDPSAELAARADDARRLAELRSVPGDRYGLYEVVVTP